MIDVQAGSGKIEAQRLRLETGKPQAAGHFGTIDHQLHVVEHEAVGTAINLAAQRNPAQGVGPGHFRKRLTQHMHQLSGVELGDIDVSGQLHVSIKLGGADGSGSAQVGQRQAQLLQFGSLRGEVDDAVPLQAHAHRTTVEGVAAGIEPEVETVELITLGLQIETGNGVQV